MRTLFNTFLHMWLNQILTINYKSCNNINLTFSKDDPNILIGINDCGKSSILKAIGLLLLQDQYSISHQTIKESRIYQIQELK